MKKENIKIDHKNKFGLTLALDAYEDYIAARILIKEGRYLVPIQLATTSVEKLFKSFVNLLGEKRVEDRIHFPSQILSKNIELFEKYDLVFKGNFLEWLDQVYDTRYSSNMHPGKEIDFGDRLFLLTLDQIFFFFFSFYREINEELGNIFFKNVSIDKVTTDNYYFSNEDLDDWLDKPQKLIKIFFVDGRIFTTEVMLEVYAPKSPFNVKPIQIKDGLLQAEIDLGQIEMLQTQDGYKFVRVKS